MSDEQRLIGLLWGEIPGRIEDWVLERIKREGLYDVWEEALDAALQETP